MSYNPTEITTTKISDLPFIGGGNSGGNSGSNSGSNGGPPNFPNTIKVEKQQKLGDVNLVYENLNVHPNPFIPEGGYEPEYPLPSRDIPQNAQNYNIDQQIKMNYVPPPPKIEDYLRDTEIITNKRIKKHQEKQKRKSDLMDLLSDFQFTIYISLLFLVFNLPIINILLLSVLGRFNLFFYPDGNINFYGIAIKSAIFGIVYYILQKTVDSIVVV
jgi:hypothetical protein